MMTASRKPFFLAAALACVALFTLPAARAQTTVTIPADVANTSVVGSGGVGQYASTPGQSPYYVGSVYQANQDDAIVFPFQLPASGVITAATFTAMLTGNSSFSTGVPPTFNVDLSGLTRTSASPTVLVSDYQGTTGFTDPALFTPADGYASHSYSGADLLAYLNTQEAAAPGEFVFFRLNSSTSAESPTATYNAFQIESQTPTGNASAPSLTLTTLDIAPAPEPSQFMAFAIGLLRLGALGMKARRRARVA